MTARGGRIPPDGRPPQAKGVGKDAKRHDLEQPATPGMSGTDLQYGDRQAFEEGQRIAPVQTQQPGQAPGNSAPAVSSQPSSSAPMSGTPDAIDFLSGKNGPEFNVPTPQRRIDESKAFTWLPILRQLATGPGASPALVNAFINQARLMAQHGSQSATIVDMNAADDGIEKMLDIGLLE